MSPVPITYLFDFEFCTDEIRPFIMAEFAANGARHMVLTSTLIRMIMGKPKLTDLLQKEIAAAGMSFVDSHAPFGDAEDLNVPDPHYRGMMLDRLKTALRITADSGVDSITIHTGNTPEMWKNHTPEQLHDALLASLEELLPLAEQLGITIAIENIWFVTNTPEKLLDAVNRFRSPYLGICFDSGHANLMRRDRQFKECAVADAWRNYGPVLWDDRILEKLLSAITTCHLHDNDGRHDQHLIPGQGNIDWRHVANALKTAPRLKCIQCETSPVRTACSIADICRVMEGILS